MSPQSNGIPRVLVTDNDRMYESAQCKALLKRLGVLRTVINPIHPRTKGQVEATHALVERTLLIEERTRQRRNHGA